ncbi:hypothetical protein LCGC14_0353390 [marine sediment metagenome]|uniref:LexA repressor DNA-binding domain-containing protein n=1 Tax=marine sediment metagenome TaxID=412755 RepID=A0A0F9TT27_9ZZZZ
MALNDLNPSMKKTYAFICDFIKQNGYSPSTRDIKKGIPLSSVSVVVYHRDKLVKHGLISYTPERVRSIELCGSLTLTFTGDDVEFIRDEFGSDPEAAIIQTLREYVVDAVSSDARKAVGWRI